MHENQANKESQSPNQNSPGWYEGLIIGIRFCTTIGVAKKGKRQKRGDEGAEESVTTLKNDYGRAPWGLLGGREARCAGPWAGELRSLGAATGGVPGGTVASRASTAKRS